MDRLSKLFSTTASLALLLIFTVACTSQAPTPAPTKAPETPKAAAPAAPAPTKAVAPAAAPTKAPEPAKAAFPTKPIEIIAPATPGGGWDATARTIQKVLQDEKMLTQPVNVVNKPGGSGSVAWAYLNEKKGDGHFLSMNSTLLFTNPLIGASNQKYTDFTQIAQLTTEWHAVAVNVDSKFKTGKELLDALKADPQSVVVGIGAGLGNDDHVSFVKAAKEGGVDITKLRVVVFPAGGDLMVALLGNKVGVISTGLSEAIEQEEAGKVRILAITAPKRLTGKGSDLPTWEEQGIKGTFGHWRGIMGSGGMPADQVKFWDDTFTKMVASKSWKDAIAKQGWEDAYLPSAKYQAFMDEESKSFTDILTAVGLVKK